MLQEYKPDDFMTDPVAVAVKGELVPNKITQNGVIRRPNPSNVESDDCGSDCDGDAELSAPKLRHRFIPGTACVLGPKIPGVFDAFVFAMLLYIFAAVVVYSIGMYQFEENLHFLIWIMIAWILSGFAAFTATTLTDPGIVPPASPEGFRERVERMTKEDKETMRACEHCNLIVQYSTRHCPWCQACCREFDHHCSVTGTCIGARNKGHFVSLQFFTGWAVFYLNVIGVIWLSMFFVSKEETWNKFVYAGQIQARIMQIQLIYFHLCWLAMYFGWWERTCFGFFPNPCYYMFFRCLRPPRPNRGYNAWKTLVRREEICCKGTRLFTVPERKLSPEDGYNCLHNV